MQLLKWAWRQWVDLQHWMQRQAIQMLNAQKHHCHATQRAALRAWRSVLLSRKQLCERHLQLSEAAERSAVCLALTIWLSRHSFKVLA
jgi:hypothetical protein